MRMTCVWSWRSVPAPTVCCLCTHAPAAWVTQKYSVYFPNLFAKFILKLCFKGMPSLYLNNTWIQMWVLVIKYYLDWGIKGFCCLFLFFRLHLISHYGFHFAMSLCKLREDGKSNLKLSKQFCVRILLVLWKYQIISSCFLNELFKNMYSICSSTSNFSLEKVSTDLSGNFSWKKEDSCNFLFCPLMIVVIWNLGLLFFFLLFCSSYEIHCLVPSVTHSKTLFLAWIGLMPHCYFYCLREVPF